MSALAEDLRFTMTTPWEGLPERARQAVLLGSGDTEIHVGYTQPLRAQAVVLHELRGRRPVPAPPAQGGGVRHQPGTVRGLHARDALPGLQGRQAQAGSPRRDARRPVDRRGLGDGDRGVRGVPGRPWNSASASRRSPAGCSRRSTPGSRFLLDVGLDYLSLDRAAGTLAGGEAQRIRLATQIGSGLVGVLYVLDEPSIGLHQRDNRRLIETLLRLRDMGNTLIVVEHDEDTIRAPTGWSTSGPARGSTAARSSSPARSRTCSADETSMTGAYLSGRRSIPMPDIRRHAAPRAERSLCTAAREHNLHDVTVSFPLGCSSPSPASRARASRRWSTTSSRRCSRTSSTARGRCRAGTGRCPGSTSSTRWCGSTSRRSGGRHGRTRRPTPASSTTCAGCSPRRPRPRSAATSRAGSRSTSRAAGARRAPATARSRSR